MEERIHATELKIGDLVLREVIDLGGDSRWVPLQITAINVQENWMVLAYETGLEHGREKITLPSTGDLVTRVSSFNEDGWWVK